MFAEDKSIIIRNGNVSLIEGRGGERIFRVLAYNESIVCVVELGVLKKIKGNPLSSKVFIANPPSKKISNRIKWKRSFVDDALDNGTLMHVAELGIPKQMAEFIMPAEIPYELEKKIKAVKYIEEYWGDNVFWRREINARAVRDAANRFGASENAVRQWFEMYKFYGEHENSLVDHHWRKGAPGVSRRDLRNEDGSHAQLGRRTDSEKLFGDNGHKRKRLTRSQFDKYSNFIKNEAWETNQKFPQIFKKWIESRVAYNRDKNGDCVIYKVDPRNFSGEENMKRVGRKLFKQFRAERDASREAKPGRRGGSSQDIVYDQLPVLDIDGTPADNFLLFGDQEITIDGVGKVTAMFAVDRASLAIVGWDVGFGTENGDSYLNCVFSAYTPKERELYRWGVPDLKGMVYGCAADLVIDRGPGISLRTQKSLVSQLRAAAKITPPGSGPSKGHAEQVMKYFQEELSNLPGSIFKIGDEKEDRVRQKEAKGKAIPLEHFMQALLKAISKRNMETDVRHLLTPDMMKSNIPACPKAIYIYNKNRRRGDAAWDWAPEDVFKRLCISRNQKAPRGIVTISGKKYTSGELQLYARIFENNHNNDSCTIKTYEIPNAPFVLFWELPGQGLGLLKATKSTQKIFEDGLGFLIKYQNGYRNHLFAEAKFIARNDIKNAIRVERAASAGGVSKAIQAKIDNVERHASIPVLVDETIGTPKERAKQHLERQKVNSIISEFTHEPVQMSDVSLPKGGNGMTLIDDGQDLFIDD